MLGVKDPVTAFDFDRACNTRLAIYDKEKARDNAKAIAFMANKAFMGDPLEFDDEKEGEDGDSDGAEVW